MVGAINKLSQDKKQRLNANYSNIQLYLLLALRIIIGYHFLYEGLNKLFADSWSSGGFLIQSNWIFSDLFIAIANSPTLVAISDVLNIWGQIFIGLGLILGLFSTTAAICGALLMFLYYVAIPPFVENLLFIDKNLLEFLAFLIIAVFPTSKIIGIDLLIRKYRRAS